jgi:predicted nucleic acid-binding Zn ribbon protein
MVDQHKHCPMCGTPIPMNERFCSPKCEQIFAERQRKLARTRKIMFAGLAIVIIIYLLYILRGQIF